MRQLLLTLALLGTLTVIVSAQDGSLEGGNATASERERHDYASLRHFDLEIDNFEVRTRDGRTIRVGDLVKDGKMILLHFFATFCHNSNYDAATVNDLYRTYRDEGLIVVGVSVYSTGAELEKFVNRHQPLYPLVAEEEMGRKKTRHYRFRTRVGDDRKWGTPLNVLIDGREVDPRHGTIARQVYVATGELVRAEAVSLIRRRISEERGSRPDEQQ
ncbi:MAG: TlpA family protein disulfide reductase [Acidobacteria bacterium]|nr:TlpA family protein disulfide reductase [Acidobacteriota bacterium]